MSSKNMNSPLGDDWYERLFADRFRGMFEDRLQALFKNQTEDRLQTLFKNQTESLFQSGFEDLYKNLPQAIISDSLSEAFQVKVPGFDAAAIGARALESAGLFDSEASTSITNALADSMPNFTAGLDLSTQKFADIGLTKLEKLFGAGSWDVSTYARLGAWAVAAGVHEDLLDWGSQVTSEDPELQSELETLRDASTAPTEETTDHPAPTTKPLPLVDGTEESQDTNDSSINVERLAAIGVMLVMAFTMATLTYILTGLIPFWGLVLAEMLKEAATPVKDRLTKKISEDVQYKPGLDERDAEDEY